MMGGSLVSLVGSSQAAPCVESQRGALAGYTQVCWNECHSRFIDDQWNGSSSR
jgi:hypothetical protein